MSGILEDTVNISNMLTACILTYNQNNKKTPLTNEDKLTGVFYTDGGYRDFGGWGVHGYLHSHHETNGNSNCKKTVPTITGYQTSAKENKANVVAYLDYYGFISKPATNNIAEIEAMLNLLELLPLLNLNKVLILADSMYVLTLLMDREKYINNGFMGSSGKPLANVDLVKKLIYTFNRINQQLEITLKHVKGHSGNFGNDKADELCIKGMNYARNLKRGSLPELNNESTKDSFFKLLPPNEYFSTELVSSKMLTESNLFVVTDKENYSLDTWYYQASFGGMMSASSPDEKRELRGKPFADFCISVVKLNKPDSLINKLGEIATNIFTGMGVVDFNLKHVTRDVIYNELLKGEINTLNIDNLNNKVTTTDGTDIINLLSPPRLAYRLANNFEIVSAMLKEIIAGNPNNNLQFVKDITSVFYDITVDKKGKQVYKPIIFDRDRTTTEIEFIQNGVITKTKIPLAVGIDLPNRLALSRLKTINPIINLFVFDISPTTLRYATHIKTDEGEGIWMGIFSNVHLLT